MLRPISIIGSALVLLGLAGCDRPVRDWSRTIEAEMASPAVTARQRAAAEKLSIVGGATSGLTGSAFEQAAECSRALAFLAGRLRQTGLVTADQIALVERIGAGYREQAQRAGLAEDRDASAIRAQLDQPAEDVDEQSRLGQSSLPCLRRAANGR